jgi:hypothetical protein
VARLLATIWRDFFWPQYRLRLCRDRRVFAIDGALDASIPFRPAYYVPYLSFVSLWIATLAFTRQHGGRASLPGWKKFLSDLEALYRDAGTISRAWPTTTTRPSGFRGPRMALVKLFDPHYHCLPSLHVLIVLHTHLSYQAWSRELPALGSKHAREWGGHLRREMLEIAESVLYVKQHSLSCIAGSLFFLTATFPEADEAFAEAFIQSLFESEGDVPAEEIRAFIRALYGKFLRRHREGIPAAEVLVRYIRSRNQEAVEESLP